MLGVSSEPYVFERKKNTSDPAWGSNLRTRPCSVTVKTLWLWLKEEDLSTTASVDFSLYAGILGTSF